MVEIRNFNNNDVKFIYDNWAENERWSGCKFDKDKLEILSQINEFNLKKFNNKYFEQFVIVNQEIPVGMISLCEQNKEEVSVNVFVHKDFRRKGIATKAYELIENVAQLKGYKNLVANVSKDNQISVNMHKKLKFIISDINDFGENQIKFIKSLWGDKLC